MTALVSVTAHSAEAVVDGVHYLVRFVHVDPAVGLAGLEKWELCRVTESGAHEREVFAWFPVGSTATTAAERFLGRM